VRRGRRLVAVAVAASALAVLPAACGEAPEPAAGPAPERAAGASRAETSLSERFPTLENVHPIRTAPATYDFLVMLRTPYASPSRYAAGWRMLTPGGEVIAVKRLARPYLGHGSFWRRQGGVRVPRSARRVQFEGRDSRNGYGGGRLTVTLP